VANQDCVVFSRNGLLVTHNVQDCVALVLKDKQSGIAALLHVATRADLVLQVLAALPLGPKSAMLMTRCPLEVDAHYILTLLAEYAYDIELTHAYIEDDRCFINNVGDDLSLYALNTGFGGLIVDAETLKVTSPGRFSRGMG